jgi:hypothetical protein
MKRISERHPQLLFGRKTIRYAVTGQSIASPWLRVLMECCWLATQVRTVVAELGFEKTERGSGRVAATLADAVGSLLPSPTSTVTTGHPWGSQFRDTKQKRPGEAATMSQ